MKIPWDGLDGFLEKAAKEGTKLYCFGAGMMPFYIEDVFAEWGISQTVKCFVDSDLLKQGKVISFGGRQVKVVSPKKAFCGDLQDAIILLTMEKTQEPRKWLEEVLADVEVDCYSYPELNLAYYKRKTNQQIILPVGEKIPKVIHYFWVGGGEMPAVCQSCINSWKIHCPDYEIICWNESNYDFGRTPYMRQAYDAGQWAFAVDYARLDVLYRCGGVYLDTDVELLRPLDSLLGLDAFVGYGEWPCVNSGSGIGAVKNLEIIRELRDDLRADRDFTQEEGGYDFTTNMVYETKSLMKYGFLRNFTSQQIGPLTVLPPDLLATHSLLGREAFVTERTIGLHHIQGSWR